MTIRCVPLSFLMAGSGFCDTLVLRGGKVVTGNFLGGNSRQIRIDTGERVETIAIGDVASISFGESAPAGRSTVSPERRLAIPAGTRFAAREVLFAHTPRHETARI